MRGMIIKDFYLLKEMKRILMLFLLFSVVMLAVGKPGEGENFVLGYINIMGVSLGLNVFAYDDYNNGRVFLMTLPVTRREYVREKYVFSMICAVTGWLFTVIATMISLTAKGGMVLNEWLPIYAAFLFISILTIALTQPFMIKYGPEKGRTAMILFLIVMFVGIVGAAKYLEKTGRTLEEIISPVLNMGVAPLIGIASVVVLVILCISYNLTVRFMEEKEF